MHVGHMASHVCDTYNIDEINFNKFIRVLENERK